MLSNQQYADLGIAPLEEQQLITDKENKLVEEKEERADLLFILENLE